MVVKIDPRSPRRVKDFLRTVIPEQGNWSEEKYLKFTDSCRHLAEYVDGFLEVLPMPTEKHQAILQYLFLAFHAVVSAGGKVFLGPLRLKIRKDLYREPDLMLLLSASDPRSGDRFWTGADLVAEVASPGDPRRDLVTKRRDYARAGIAEYWIVNPMTEKILVLKFDGKKYRRAGSYARGDSAHSSLLKDFRVDVASVFDAR